MPPQHSVTVSIDADAPILHIFESHRDDSLAELRLLRIDTVEEEPLTPSAPPTPGDFRFLPFKCWLPPAAGRCVGQQLRKKLKAWTRVILVGLQGLLAKT